MVKTLPALLLILALLCGGCACNQGGLNEPGPEDLELESLEMLFPWRAVIKEPASRLTARPGGVWELDFDLEVDLRRHLPGHGRFKGLVVAVYGERRYDHDGGYRSSPSAFALSSHFTTTGVPIQTYESWPEMRLIHGKNGSPFEGIKRFELAPGQNPARRHLLSGKVRVELPADTPAGYYEPYLTVLADVEGAARPLYLKMFSFALSAEPPPPLPLVAVGKAATPRMPWTIFSQIRRMGRAGTLALEHRGKVALNIRTTFPSPLLLRPGRYPLTPGFPSLYPSHALPPIAGGGEDYPEELDHYFVFDTAEVSLRVEGPSGSRALGRKRLLGTGNEGRPPKMQGGAYQVDMTRPGKYRFNLQGQVKDRYGRPFHGGGTYEVYSGLPLTFDTSCKPGTSFLVGGVYPPKVNLNPPVPATVEVTVEYYPASDVKRMRRWHAVGKANRFGHFVPTQPPLRFDEPGEYRSLVKARYTDSRGQLWMGIQSSAGVVAPQKPTVSLHGTRSFPDGIRPAEPNNGGVKRFKARDHLSNMFLINKPIMPPEPRNPYNTEDTLFFTTTGFNDLDLESLFSVSVPDKKLARALIQANTLQAAVMPAGYQRPGKPWRPLKEIIPRGKAITVTWYDAASAPHDELPISSVARGPYHPVAFPGNNRVDAYVYSGVVRPGFPAMTSVLEKDGLGFYWCTNPNEFGHHINSGTNGDLPGDIYRVQAGLVLKDNDTGKTYYDAYSSVFSTVQRDTPTSAILAPGEWPLMEERGRKHYIFLATDTHDVLEVGERMGLGGMVFPAVRAQVTWTVTTPSGRQHRIVKQANRLGIVGGGGVQVDEPGVYKVQVQVAHGKLRGSVVGTVDGAFWHCAVPTDSKHLLRAGLPPMSRVNVTEEVTIPLTWPRGLKRVKLHIGVLMPGQVVEQRVVTPADNSFTYRMDLQQAALRISYLDVKNFGTGRPALADTIVFQFFLEAEGPEGKVYDSRRVTMRGSRLFNYTGL